MKPLVISAAFFLSGFPWIWKIFPLDFINLQILCSLVIVLFEV